MGRNFIVTVRHGSMRDHSPVRTQLEATPWMLTHGADFVLHAILDFIVDGYLDVIDVLEDEVLAMEDRALDAFLDREQTGAVFSLRRDLFRLQRVLGPMQDVAARCMNLQPAADRCRHARRISATCTTMSAAPITASPACAIR